MDRVHFGEGAEIPTERDDVPVTYTLAEHFAAMQDMMRAFLEPGPYTEQTGDGASAAEEDYHAQCALFASDMLYMLDGPEQRRAQSSVTRGRRSGAVTPDQKEAWRAKAALLRDRGRRNTSHDIEQAADYLDIASSFDWSAEICPHCDVAFGAHLKTCATVTSQKDAT